MYCNNLAKLGSGLDESPIVKVGEAKNRGILKPSWAFVETYMFLEWLGWA